MNDLISRQAVLGYIDRVLTIGTGKKKSLDFVRKYIETLPSAQETHEERTETHACDCISRQSAIAHAVPLNLFGREVMMVSVSELENLPSAQPEIIHCCECRYWKPGHITDDDDFVPPSCAVGWVPGFWHATDYCSYAERKQDD